MGDLINILLILRAQQNDTLSLSDDVIQGVPTSNTPGDSFNFQDSTGFTLNILLQFFDSLSLSDSIITKYGTTLIELSLNDTLSFTDFVNPVVSQGITSYLRRYLNDVN